MVRIIIKGGVWKNTEDEVLKAAIAKYGKNQWARISSLLVRKTPKQCKARWYEWLDPSIKKTEWSKTEDEKLLHLAKLMPTQWRTIAPIVGRTATQCLERYQQLLDEAEAKDNEELGLSGAGDEAGPSSSDVRKLKPGEIDPDPETKPARPDPIDMDEDEKEMLSEARARLANTQGKKAKRKARERQLEEARRLAMLQKRRELKAAGIMSGMRAMKKRKGIDYNADIPFEKKAAPGFYDTSEEQARTTTAPIGQSLRRLESKRKPAEDEMDRRKRQKRDEEGPHQTKFVAARDAQIQKLKEAEQISKRRQLILPNAQVGELELEGIIKMGQAGRAARNIVDDGSDTSGILLDDQDGLGMAQTARTPRTAPIQDNVMNEARNLRNMTMSQTPLLGDENTPLRGLPDGSTGFDGATPRHQVAMTPNPLATPRLPGGEVTPLRTPMRDSLSINQGDAYSTIGDTPRHLKSAANQIKHSLRNSFRDLPKPENNFELLVPENEGLDEAASGGIHLEDAAERDARERLKNEVEERKELARRSAVVRLGLPRLPNIDVDKTLKSFSLIDASPVRKLIDIEFAQLMQHDAIAHPIPGSSRPGGSHSFYEHPEDEYMQAARSIILHELASLLGFPDATEDQMIQGLSALARDEKIDESLSWAWIRQKLFFDVATGTWVDSGILDIQRKVAGFAQVLEEVRESMARESSKTAKSEKKLGVTLGGYQNRSNLLSRRVVDAFEELQRDQSDLESFSRLRVNEGAAGPRRVQALQEEIERLEVRERYLQGVYKELEVRRGDVQGRIAAMEEQIMADAENLNEAALNELDSSS